MAQGIERLPCKHKALCSNPSVGKKKQVIRVDFPDYQTSGETEA
jgi:hypothetical protein